MGLRDRMAEATRKAEAETPEPEDTESVDAEAEVEETDEEAYIPTPEEVTGEAPSADEVSELVEGLSDEEIAEALAKLSHPTASAPLVANVKATRTTKRDQIQYDGETPEGYVVRVWAPGGSEMVASVAVNIIE